MAGRVRAGVGDAGAAAVAGGTSGVICQLDWPVGGGFQQDVGVDQQQAVDLDPAGQQRQQAEFQFERLERGHLRAGEAGRIGESDVVHADGRAQRKFQADLAVQDQVAAGGALHRLDDAGFQAVRIELGEEDGRRPARQGQ